MTKSNDVPFTYHERLRYSYLLKNLARLNGQQASEFNYLQGKLDAYEAERSYERYQGQRADYQEACANLMIIVQIIIRSLSMRMSTS